MLVRGIEKLQGGTVQKMWTLEELLQLVKNVRPSDL